jgi:nucleotide-binding universal stress UspA family protein
MFQKILIPVDGSRCGDHAAKFGLEFAKRLGAHVVLTNALIEYATEKDARRVIGPTREMAEKLGVPFEVRLAEGRFLSIGDGIIEASQESNCELIIMGTHGREGIPRMLLGSVAEWVSRRASVPVMLIRELMHPTTHPSGELQKLERILVAVDGSPQSNLALITASDLACTLGINLELMHVIPDIPAMYSYTAYEYAPMIDFEKYQHDLEAESQAIIAAALALLDAHTPKVADVRTSRVPANGTKLGDAIIKTAKEHNADLIVIGTHGRSGVDVLLLGSVAERVSHRSEVPVLMIRAHEVKAEANANASVTANASVAVPKP